MKCYIRSYKKKKEGKKNSDRIVYLITSPLSKAMAKNKINFSYQIGCEAKNRGCYRSLRVKT